MNKQKVKERIASNVGVMLLHILELVDEIPEKSLEEIFRDAGILNDWEIARGILNLWFQICAERGKGDTLNKAVDAVLKKFQKQYIDEGESANDELRVE